MCLMHLAWKAGSLARTAAPLIACDAHRVHPDVVVLPVDGWPGLDAQFPSVIELQRCN